jgi:S1-C subfamily serine protease
MMRTLAFVTALAGFLACKQEPDRCPQHVPGAKELVTAHAIPDVAERVTKSVVSVMASKQTGGGGGGLWPFETKRNEVSMGSGVIVSTDGVVITNSHVVERADRIKVALQDGRTLDAKLVGTDPKTDVAVLRIAAHGLPAIAIADSSRLRIGELVLAVGNPFGIGQTVTMGIISGLGRTNMGITAYDDFIQTDAAINPGNSGGALVDMNGRLVGINTAIISTTGGYQGIGFAIPSKMAIEIKDAIVAHGRVLRGWLGVSVRDVTDPPHGGVVVVDVQLDSPAAKAGLRPGDVITSLDGVKTTDAGEFRNLIAMSGSGRSVHVAVRRGGVSRAVELRLREPPEEAEPDDTSSI